MDRRPRLGPHALARKEISQPPATGCRLERPPHDLHAHFGACGSCEFKSPRVGWNHKANAQSLRRRDRTRRRGIELALAEAARFGVTSIQDNSPWDDFLVYRELKQEGKLTVRITEWLPFTDPLPKLEAMRMEGGTTDPWLRTGALKMVTDGALGSRTAAMLAPYSDDPSTSGILTLDPEKLKQMAVE